MADTNSTFELNKHKNIFSRDNTKTLFSKTNSTKVRPNEILPVSLSISFALIQTLSLSQFYSLSLSFSLTLTVIPFSNLEQQGSSSNNESSNEEDWIKMKFKWTLLLRP